MPADTQGFNCSSGQGCAVQRSSPWKLGVAEEDEMKTQILWPLCTGEAFKQEVSIGIRC